MVGTLRAASENYKQNGRCTQSPNVAMGIATLTRHRLTSQSIFQEPRSPYIAEREFLRLLSQTCLRISEREYLRNVVSEYD